uniref:CYTH domain-containing protein n=1 Tax=Chromera velia CCMP2878 TaxID=1169474 RepID=A0A0G4HBU4_9ALVE|eukprot:Cvel_26027.t1-p1 / transcript=Cvel_26027.t1 / gene=Cvel_26027 / organism=Chromera_velia_CCMP2878 / gene_product=hypothetical protein / transcript_product=hypothetical protein / location=Cvel_scaffold3032:1616-2656(-) / protein_length=347 / sequence_SO=supercontig / SO=protein_coding / is_pseudo=false
MATTTASTAETDMETAGVALSSETVKTSAPLLQKKPMQIEVEKRFFIPDTLSERIQRLGGRQEKFVTFSDSYWDFPDPPFSPPNSTKTTETQNGHTFLTNQDIWLRRRTVTSSGAVPSSQWELKVPLDLSGASSEGGEGEGKRGGSARSGGELATFHEIEGVRDVSLELLRLLEDADIPSEDRKVTDHLGPLSCLPDCEGSLSESPADETESLEAALRKMGMAPFAEFETRRTKFSVPVRVGGLQGTRGVEEVKGDSDRISQNRDETEKLMRASVDVDAASFGHGVMEIELLCERPEDVSKMENAIVTLAAEMGASQMGNHGGKLETYIRRFCPSVLQRLQRCGILR